MTFILVLEQATVFTVAAPVFTVVSALQPKAAYPVVPAINVVLAQVIYRFGVTFVAWFVAFTEAHAGLTAIVVHVLDPFRTFINNALGTWSTSRLAIVFGAAFGFFSGGGFRGGGGRLLGQTTLLLSTFLFSLCLLYTSPSPRDRTRSRMPSSA